MATLSKGDVVSAVNDAYLSLAITEPGQVVKYDENAGNYVYFLNDKYVSQWSGDATEDDTDAIRYYNGTDWKVLGAGDPNRYLTPGSFLGRLRLEIDRWHGNILEREQEKSDEWFVGMGNLACGSRRFGTITSVA
jgi:hypothetical protein